MKVIPVKSVQVHFPSQWYVETNLDFTMKTQNFFAFGVYIYMRVTNISICLTVNGKGYSILVICVRGAVL